MTPNRPLADSTPFRDTAAASIGEHLLTNFDRLVEAPEAMPRLRRFVLDLAVRGKLVEQDPNDEPASELLKRIEAEKERLLKLRRLKNTKPLPMSSEQKCSFIAPSGWVWSQLAEIGFLSPRNYSDGGIQVSFVPMALIPSEYGVLPKHQVRPWAEIKSGYTHFAEGDVGLAKITPCFENGKSTIFRGLTGGIGAGTTELHIVRPVIVDSAYLLIFLKCSDFISSGISRMTGTAGQKRVPLEHFAYSPFPLPPIAEQQRIVAKVDELMALCDRLDTARMERELTRDRLSSASLARLNAPDPDPAIFADHARFALDNLAALTMRTDQIKQLRRAILNLAVRGRLVPQNPDDEPAAEPLKRIAAERDDLVEKQAIRREKPLEPIGPTEPPFEIPSKWVWSRVGNAVLFTQYGTSQKSHSARDGVPVLTMGNIQDGLAIWGNEKTIPESSDDLPALYLNKFDILYNRTNSAELVGKTGIYLGENGIRTFASYLIRIRTSQTSGCPRYLNLAMCSPEFRETQIVPLIKKQTGQANVNGTALKNMLIPFPPLAEQHRIVAKVDELMRLCDQLEEHLTTIQGSCSLLLETVLNEAVAPAL
jgi:type I restriction enzyme S subunit